MLNRLKLLIYTHFIGKEVGRDSFGNTYFQHKTKHTNRWVIYNGVNDPSKIPANWHVWLHSTHQAVPESNLPSWIPNSTQTPFALKGAPSIECITPNKNTNYTKWSPKDIKIKNQL